MLIARANEIRGVDLLQPYYHTIPTISLPQVLSPSQLEFLGKNSTLYWTDSQVNEVKRTGLTSGNKRFSLARMSCRVWFFNVSKSSLDLNEDFST